MHKGWAIVTVNACELLRCVALSLWCGRAVCVLVLVFVVFSSIHIKVCFAFASRLAVFHHFRGVQVFRVLPDSCCVYV